MELSSAVTIAANFVVILGQFLIIAYGYGKLNQRVNDINKNSGQPVSPGNDGHVVLADCRQMFTEIRNDLGTLKGDVGQLKGKVDMLISVSRDKYKGG